jgi:hypothetical protein
LRLVVELIILFFAYLIIYRRLIEPFMEGYRNRRKIYNDPKVSETLYNKSATRHPSEIEGNARQQILDADFEEIESKN